jgi:hypothetical protein
MRENGGNKREEKKPYTKSILTGDGKVSELTSVGKSNARNGGSEKKTYTKSTLTIYGTIRDLTKVVGRNGPADGGTAPKTQSQV